MQTTWISDGVRTDNAVSDWFAHFGSTTCFICHDHKQLLGGLARYLTEGHRGSLEMGTWSRIDMNKVKAKLVAKLHQWQFQFEGISLPGLFQMPDLQDSCHQRCWVCLGHCSRHGAVWIQMIQLMHTYYHSLLPIAGWLLPCVWLHLSSWCEISQIQDCTYTSWKFGMRTTLPANHSKIVPCVSHEHHGMDTVSFSS